MYCPPIGKDGSPTEGDSLPLIDDALLVGEVCEVRGAKVRVRVYGEANEAHTFYHGKLVKGVSVGGYLKIPCGYDRVIGAIDADYQQERRVPREDADREAPGHDFDRFVDVSVFGVLGPEGFDRGVSVLPPIRSKAYLLGPDELKLVNAAPSEDGPTFRVGTLAGHEGTPVCLPTSALFASHIGVFGNTGSGKSNTLCRLYTDCFAQMERAGTLARSRSTFTFIDFNGEYVADGVLTDCKKVYRLSTRLAVDDASADRVPVPSDFYFDVDMWAVLTNATEKTQKPFLKRCVRTAGNVRNAGNPSSYLRKMLESLLGNYAGNAFAFGEQKNDLIHMLSLALTQGEDGKPEQRVADSLKAVGTNRKTQTVYTDTDDYLNKDADVHKVFKDCLELPYDFYGLTNDLSRLLEYIAYYKYLEEWLTGRIIRDHVSPWLSRYAQQLHESLKLYQVCNKDIVEAMGEPVVVCSLLDVNQDQKKVIPLVIAKYLYREQKERGKDDPMSSTHLIVDEAHNILSYSSQRESESWRDYRLETFEEIVKEGRKFGMYLTVCSQRPADISPTIVSQMHNYFIHRLVNDEDLKAIAKSVSFIDDASMSMIPVLPQGCCIVSGTAATHPTMVQVDRLEREKQPRSYDRDLAKAWGLGGGEAGEGGDVGGE